jgi:hypothetical protein
MKITGKIIQKDNDNSNYANKDGYEVAGGDR